MRTVGISLAALGLTAAISGDALTAVPLAAAFWLRSSRGERLAGRAVVLAIFASACAALYEAIQRLITREHLSHLPWSGAAGELPTP